VVCRPAATGGKQDLLRFLVVVHDLTTRVPHPLHERSCRLDDARANFAVGEMFLVNNGSIRFITNASAFPRDQPGNAQDMFATHC
jgi:hypothetical protein